MRVTRRRLLLAALLLALIPATALAAEAFTGDEVVVSEPVTGDLYLFGSDVIINAPVDGDVLVAAGRVRILAPVSGSVHALAGDVFVHADIGGSLMAAGSSVVVSADVGHAVRAAAPDVVIEQGRVSGDLVAAASRLRVESRATIEGETLMRVSSAEIDGNAQGGMRGSAGELRVSGVVGAPSDVRVGTLRFMPGATIEHAFAYTSDHEMLVDGGTTITGAITRSTPDHPSFGETIGRSLLFALFRFGWGLATGWLLLRYIPDTVQGVSDTLRVAPGRSVAWGLLAVFGTPLVALAIAISVIGIPVAIVLLALYLFALYASQVVVGMVIGKAIVQTRWRTVDGEPATLRMLAVGLAIVALLRSLPLDGWNPLVSFVTATIALGAIVMYFFRPRPAGLDPATA